MKIIDTLIHRLGGHTEAELSDVRNRIYDKGFSDGWNEGSRKYHESFEKGCWHGRKVIYDSLMKKADELYGLPSDDWCKEMYSFIQSIRTKL